MNNSNSERSLGELYNKRENSFDIIRLFLAIVVIYSHSFILLLGQEHGADIVVKISNNQISAAGLAVNSFFVISGFLITQSLTTSKSYLKYYKNRFLRIFPAFLFSLLIISFIIGPFLSESSLKEYFMLGINSPYDFVLKNLSFNFFGYSWTAGDLFQGNPFPGSANGSMWTLKHEFALYLILPILSYFLFFKYKKLYVSFVVIVCLLSAFNILHGYMLFNIDKQFLWVLNSNEYSNFIKLSPYFFIGSILYLYKEKILIHKRFVLLSIIVTAFGWKIGMLNIALIVTLPYLLIYFAIKGKFSFIRKYGDYSYGMYIYAFPIQQTIVHLWGKSLSLFSFFIISMSLSFVLSFISWNLIEKQFMKLK